MLEDLHPAQLHSTSRAVKGYLANMLVVDSEQREVVVKYLKYSFIHFISLFFLHDNDFVFLCFTHSEIVSVLPMYLIP